jgi:hypothetical protein
MSDKMDRQGARTAADLERKYQFGKKFQEIMGLVDDTRGSISELESTLKGEYGDVSTSIRRTAEKVTIEALKEYTDTDGVTELLNSKLEASATGIRGEVTKEIGDKIKAVKDGIEEQYGDIKKSFTFDLEGLSLCAVDVNGNPSPNKVVIDNDEILIKVNNNPVQQFKADGTSEIPSLKVTKEFKVLGLTVTEDDTHINFDYIVG